MAMFPACAAQLRTSSKFTSLMTILYYLAGMLYQPYRKRLQWARVVWSCNTKRNARMEIINQDADGIYQLRLPLPFALNSMNCYLLRDGDGWTVIDAGLNYPSSRETWQQALAALQVPWRGIQRIILTHTHPDHYGAAGWLAEQSGAPVYASAVEQRFAEWMWRNGDENDPRMLIMFQQHGVPAALTEQVLGDIAALRAQTGPHPALHTLEPGPIKIGGRRFDAFCTPGHSDGHMVL